MAQTAVKRYDLLVVREDGDKNWWTRIGVGFENKTQDGFQLRFDALPIADKNGEVRVVMKLPSEREDRR